MRLTKEQSYAVLFVSILATRPERLLSVREIANDYQLPYEFLKKIAGKLKEARLVKVKEGAAGGHGLAIPAREITLAEIVEVFQGPIHLIDHTVGDFDLINLTMQQVSRDVRQVLAKVRLTDIIATAPVLKD